MKNKKIWLIAISIIAIPVITIIIASLLWLINEHNKATKIAIKTQDELRLDLINSETENQLKITWDYENIILELENVKTKSEFIKSNKEKLDKCILENNNNMWSLAEPVICDYEFWNEDVAQLENIIEITKAEALEPGKIVKKPWLRFNWSYEKDGWLVNSAWLSQARFTLEWTNPDSRTLDLVKRYWFSDSDSQLWLDTEDWYWIMRWVLVCISKTDSSLWKALKTTHNYGNVWNTDSWATRSFATAEAWIKAMWSTLNNRLLWYKQSIWSLSRWWWWSAPIYATSMDNWNNNTLNCLRVIYQDEKIDEHFNFRK